MKVSVIIFILLSLLANAVSLESDQGSPDFTRNLITDWCSLTCGLNKEKNIACAMGGKCHAKAPCKFDCISKEKIIEVHNQLRNDFAAGKESRSGGIKVSNMMALKWDDDLAFTASCNVASCGPMAHDKCRTTPRFSQTAGQNLWTYMVSVTGGDCVGNSIKGVKQWYDEVKKMKAAKIKAVGAKYQFDHGTGHFTQVIWAETTHVGCSLTKNEHGGQTKCSMACNYGIGGNVIGSKMFQEGKPCSACPNGVNCGTTFPALCGEGGLGDSSGGGNGGDGFLPNNSRIIMFVFVVHYYVK